MVGRLRWWIRRRGWREAPYLLRKALSWAKRVIFRSIGRLSGIGAISALKGAVIGGNDVFPCQKSAFTGGMGALFASKGTVMGEKSAFHARRTLSLAGGAPYLPIRAPSWTKRALFVTEGHLRWWDERHSFLEGRRRAKRATFCNGWAPSLVD